MHDNFLIQHSQMTKANPMKWEHYVIANPLPSRFMNMNAILFGWYHHLVRTCRTGLHKLISNGCRSWKKKQLFRMELVFVWWPGKYLPERNNFRWNSDIIRLFRRHNENVDWWCHLPGRWTRDANRHTHMVNQTTVLFAQKRINSYFSQPIFHSVHTYFYFFRRSSWFFSLNDDIRVWVFWVDVVSL